VNTALQKVLLVDDNPDIRMIARLGLEKFGGLTVCACASGAEALGMVEQFAPQLVMLDVMMPDMDGPAVLKRLRESPGGKNIPVVFLTASTMAAEVDDLRALGAIGVLSKPFDPLTLHQKIKAIWSESAQ